MSSNTIGHHLERFLRSKHNASTRAWYANYLRPMAIFLGVNRPIDTVARVDAEAYWAAVRARKVCWATHPSKPTENRPLSPTTLHNFLRAARTFWNAMVRYHAVEYNPFDHLQSPKDTRPVAMKAIAPEDLTAIWQAAKRAGKRDLAIVTVMATTGVRAGELVNMSLGQLDLKKGTAWVVGKRGWRQVFLGAMSVQAIKSYLNERPQTQTDKLWLNAIGNPLTTDGVRQIVDRLADQAGVTGRHNLHSFRHRTAQAWLDKGVNAEIVSQMLGHADVNVTLQIYGNQDERRVRAAMRQVEFSPFEVEELEDSALGEIVEPARDI